VVALANQPFAALCALGLEYARHGGDTRSILQLVLREGVLLVGIGLVGGLVGAVALRSVIASQLYGVGALDPMVILAVTAVLAVAALVACVGPARKAAKVNPVVALTG